MLLMELGVMLLKEPGGCAPKGAGAEMLDFILLHRSVIMILKVRYILMPPFYRAFIGFL